MRFGTVRATYLLLAACLLAAAPGGARAEEGRTTIEWITELPKAFEKAKETGKPLMICINAKRVAGSSRFEPAARELRENTYKHPDVVKLAEKFVCAFVTPEGTSEDYGELRSRFGIDGDIVSPQHIFAFPDGRIISRQEYWPYGVGKQAVDALLKMMNAALKRHEDRLQAHEDDGGKDGSTPATPGDQPPASNDGGDQGDPGNANTPPPDPEDRAKWIEAQIQLVSSPDEIVRRDALRALVDADNDGDIVTRLIELLEPMKKDTPVLVDILRELGRPGLEIAAAPVAEYLDHKEACVRGTAAVSLEYIGSKTSVADLSRRAPRERDESVANHMFRALGRCGVGDAKVRSTLAKHVSSAKTNFASYGPIIGLAYFERDEKTARTVEKLVRKYAMPSSGWGGWDGVPKRSLLGWCLAETGFGDAKSAKFVNEEVIPGITENRWSRLVRTFWIGVRDCCNGDEDALVGVRAGADRALSGGGAGGRFGGSGSGDPSLMDEARLHRGHVPFTPKGEFGPVTGPAGGG